MKLKSAREFLKALYKEVGDDDIALVAGAVTYNIILAVIPFLVFVLTLLPYFIPEETVNLLIEQLQLLMPSNTAQSLTTEIERILLVERNNILVFSLAFSLWSASSAVNVILRALNKAYNVQNDERSWIHRRLLAAIGAITTAGAIFIAGAAIIGGNVTINFLQSKGFLQSPWLTTAVQTGRFLTSILLVTLVWSFLYWLLPNKSGKYRLLSVGAVVGVTIWVAASMGFSVYVSRFGNYATTYGSLAGVIISLLWVYISALALLLGAEINVTLAKWKSTGQQEPDAPIRDIWERNGNRANQIRGDHAATGDIEKASILSLLNRFMPDNDTRWRTKEEFVAEVKEALKQEVIKYKQITVNTVLAYLFFLLALLFFSVAVTVSMATVLGNWAYFITALVFVSAGYLLDKRSQSNSTDNRTKGPSPCEDAPKSTSPEVDSEGRARPK